MESSGQGSQPKVRKVTNVLVSNVQNAVKSMVIVEANGERFWRFGEHTDDTSDLRLLIPCRNGIIHLGRLAAGRDDYFIPSTPEFFTCNAIPCDYDPDASSPVWEEMLQKNLVESNEKGEKDLSRLLMLQEFFGYCLIPSNELQKFLILEGEGSNGKSAVLCGFSVMMGGRNTSNISLDLFGDKFAMNSLRGKLVNIVDDLTETDKVCEGRLKSIVSGMEISTDRKNREGISFVPTARLIFGTNNRPRFNDRSSGVQRRIEIIPFTRQITEAEKKPEYCNRTFWESHKSGILNWCLSGLKRLWKQRMRLTSCKASEAAKLEYTYEINPSLLFFQECVEEKQTGTVVCSKLYEIYTKWCVKNGLRALNNVIVNFTPKSLRRNINVRRPGTGGVCFAGMRRIARTTITGWIPILCVFWPVRLRILSRKWKENHGNPYLWEILVDSKV